MCTGTRPFPSYWGGVWGRDHTSSALWDTQDVARHVTVMTTHRFGIAMHQPLSRAAIAGYSAVSYRKPHGATDWLDRIQKHHVSKQAQDIPDPILLLGVGSGGFLAPLQRA